MHLDGQHVGAAKQVGRRQREAIENRRIADFGGGERRGIHRPCGHVVAINLDAVEKEKRAIVHRQVERELGARRVVAEQERVAEIIGCGSQRQRRAP